MNMKYFYLLLCFVKYLTCEKYNGESCVIKESSAQGTCKPILQCPDAFNKLRNNIIPQRCGSEGTVPFFCCENEIQIPTLMKPGDLSKIKCKEYADYAYQIEESPLPTLDNEPVKRYKCNVIATPLVVGGEKADFGEFPHMALIGYMDSKEIKWNCGGSIISPNFILTAGHCLYDQTLGAATYAAIGMTKIGQKTQQIVKIIEVISYPEYHPPSHYNDIGLLRIEGATMNSYARPACLNTNFKINHENSLASGWGVIGHAKRKSKDLLKVKLEFFSNKKCKYTYRDVYGSIRLIDGIKENTQICAGSTLEMKDTCEGDSGGPLQIYHDPSDGAKCMYDVVGITSFGKSCGLVKNSPGVYTRVSAYIKWIEDTIWQ